MHLGCFLRAGFGLAFGSELFRAGYRQRFEFRTKGLACI